MSKLLGGIFIGVFAGAFAFELLKRIKPDWADTLHGGVALTVDGLENVVSSFKGKKSENRRAQSIPVE
jgi:hypothetical protein